MCESKLCDVSCASATAVNAIMRSQRDCMEHGSQRHNKYMGNDIESDAMDDTSQPTMRGLLQCITLNLVK